MTEEEIKSLEEGESADDKFTSIDMMARLTDVNIKTGEICDKWLLITYDIPKSEAGDKARREFLAQAALLGASKHTDSVYLMPWTPDAEHIALNLAKVGDVCVWTSQTTNNLQALEITRSYDEYIEETMKKIEGRLDAMSSYINQDLLGRANQMFPKTEKMMDGLGQTVSRRNSAVLMLRYMMLQEYYKSVVSGL